MTPLMICAEAGQNGFRMVVGLVSAGCDISSVDKMGMTALHYACYVGAIATVRFLIEEAGEFSDKRPLDQLNFQDRFGRTPIYLATSRGHTEVVTYLLSCNVNIHSPNKELKSPLYIAANFGHLDIVNALLRHGALGARWNRRSPLPSGCGPGRTGNSGLSVLQALRQRCAT
ncbi:unnamed protein product [Schistocephalus solidus]|uniref:ANK_REP_REGION domain-containing protein n=1 Tax=Schistocephalus solidus TaxID=70667 RepID=A0A183S8Y3_SCHSO|nr:unnamed protein product [Schistocephalus solidus]